MNIKCCIEKTNDNKLFELSNMKVIKIEGEDSEKFLQGQVTCDVTKINNNQSTFGAMCNPHGKVISTFIILNYKHCFYFFINEEIATEHINNLKKYSIFSKVTIKMLNTSIFGINKIDDPSFKTLLDDYVSCTVPSSERVLFFEEKNIIDIDEMQKKLDINKLGCSTEWDFYDIVNFFPKLSKETSSLYLPQALSIDLINAVSFDKGCYTGQENVARAKYRGINKKSLYLLTSNENTNIKIDTTFSLERSIGETWRTVGKPININQNPITGKTTLLIVLPNNIDSNQKLRIKDRGDLLFTFKKASDLTKS